jgi:hypothetical protein
MSTSKRKRKREELEEVKEEESLFKKDKQRFLLEYKRLKEQNDELCGQL